MTIVTGTSDFQPLFQGLLSEQAVVGGQSYGMEIVKLSGDSVVGASLINTLIPGAYDFVEIIYTGTNIAQVIFKNLGNTTATLLLTYDVSNNLKTVTRT